MKWLSRTTRRILPQRPWLPAHDLLRDAAYRRLWTSILISSLGGQVTMLALPLTAAVLLQATPTQMGLLTAMEIVPFVLFSLPAGVWLDRVRKLPVYIVGECLLGVAVASVPLAWWAGWLTIGWLYVVGLVIGTVFTIAGSAAQIVLTQVVAARAAGRGACQERPRGLGRRGPGAGPGRRADQGRGRAPGPARRRGAARLLGRDPARRADPRDAVAHRRRRLADGEVLGRSQGRRALRRPPSPAGRARPGGRRLAGLSPRRAGGADPVRDPHPRPLGAGDRPQLHGDGRRARSWRASSATASAAASGRARAWCWASRSAAPAGCCSRWRRRACSASPPSPPR